MEATVDGLRKDSTFSTKRRKRKKKKKQTIDAAEIGVDIPLDRLSILRDRVLQLPFLRQGFRSVGTSGTRGKVKGALLPVKVTGIAFVDHLVHSTAALSAETSVTTGSIPAGSTGSGGS